MARSTSNRSVRPVARSGGRRRAVQVGGAMLAASALVLTGCTGGGDDRGDGNSLKILVAKHALTKAIGDMAWVADL